MDPQAQEELLRQEMAALADADILALCYAFKGKTARLRFYLDILRRRGGARAQFASCLICFDLARQGDPSLQQEFVLLADTVRTLAKDRALVAQLIGTDAYLVFIWELCQAALREMDPLEAEPTVTLQRVAQAQPLAELNLLGDDDFDDFGVVTDDASMWRRFDEAVEHFLGGVIGVPSYERGAGFRLAGRRDIERFEEFLTRLDSLRELVPPARGFRALALLFYGAQLRSRSLFGNVNARKQYLLREGLREFVRSGKHVWEVAGVLGPMHAEADAWPRIAEVVADYLRWQAGGPDDPGVDAYDPLAAPSARGR